MHAATTLPVPLSDVANLAAVFVGLLAIFATVRVAQLTRRLQATQIQQSRYDELTQVLLQINKLLPRIGDSTAFSEQYNALRFLASRADQLIVEVESRRITPFDLLSIGNAFYQVSGMEKAAHYLDQALEKSSAPFDHIPILCVRAGVAFSVGDPDTGRRTFREAIDTAQRWRATQPDIGLDTAFLQTLNWAGHEDSWRHALRRDELLAQAETYLPEFVSEWRRDRGRKQLEQFRARIAAAVQPTPPAVAGPPGPESPDPIPGPGRTLRAAQ